MSETPSLKLRTEAVRLWGTSTVTLAQSAQDCVKSIQRNLEAYAGMPSVSGDVAYASERLETALLALYDAEATLERIVTTRMAEEQNR